MWAVAAARDARQAAKTLLRHHYRAYIAVVTVVRAAWGSGLRYQQQSHIIQLREGGLPLHLKPPFRKRPAPIGRFGLIDDTRTSF